MFTLTVSTTEPKNIKETMADSVWIEVMPEELHQFDRLQVWELVDKPFGKKVIKLKWLWKNKKGEDQTVIRNKARLVAIGYAQEDDGRENGIFNGPLKEEVYVAQPKGFFDPDHPEKVYRLRKSLYGLKQASRAWTSDLPIPMRYLYQSDQFLGDKLVSWMSKKQDCTAMSSAEAEYVALSASCAQVMWMRTQLQDYGFNYNKIPLYCDSQSAIAISCNPVQHSRTKHIHTRYHFIKEQVENGIIELYFVRTEYQLADMFTKALPEDRFQYLVRRIGMRCLTPAELEVLAYEYHHITMLSNKSFLACRVKSVGSTAPLEKCCEIRKLDSMSYHAPGACLRPYRAFFSLILVDGASWLIEVDTRELAKITALRVAAS
ncbi:retrovirus-related pol polyprotein from transposon TNT 1-94 [Tanacetum coccineum]